MPQTETLLPVEPPTRNPMALKTIRNAVGLQADLYANGFLRSICWKDLQVNLFAGTPVEGVLSRLYLRTHRTNDVSCVRVGIPSERTEVSISGHAPCIQWAQDMRDYTVTTQLILHPDRPDWMWRLNVQNLSGQSREISALYGQDVGLAPAGALLQNESYASHYLDHSARHSSRWGWITMTRQNQSNEQGHHPWLVQGCRNVADSFSTDAFQFFGLPYRMTGRPMALQHDQLPSEILQYELAYSGLTSQKRRLNPGESTEICFFAALVDDHPQASGQEDVSFFEDRLENFKLDECDLRSWENGQCLPQPDQPCHAVKLAQSEPFSAEADEIWAGSSARHLERDGDTWLSWFTGDSHLITQEKERRVWRPHAHILHGIETLHHREQSLAVTVYAMGVFGAQICVGNPNLHRYTSVVREALNLRRHTGIRIEIKAADGWQLLGIPTTFEMGPGWAKWRYKVLGRELDIVGWISTESPSYMLEAKIIQGDPLDFNVLTDFIASDDERTGSLHMAPNPERQWIDIRWPDENTAPGIGTKMCRVNYSPSFSGVHSRQMINRLQFTSDSTLTWKIGISVSGNRKEDSLVLENFDQARVRLHERDRSLCGFLDPERISDPSAQKIMGILPWFVRNALVHYNSPHGLEQFGGGAWGTRDVCQGPVELWKATGQSSILRDIVIEVYRAQYPDGTWPQWFMLEPYADIRQKECHGDIILWPLKALCDYVESSEDYRLFDERIPYAEDRESDVRHPDPEPLRVHVARQLAKMKRETVPGTELLSYGDGDWNDTLQPAQPELRSNMASGWTVALHYEVLKKFETALRHAEELSWAQEIAQWRDRIKSDFRTHILRNRIPAGFVLYKPGHSLPEVLLHPEDKRTGIQYRLLSMQRAVLSELLTTEEAELQCKVIQDSLLYPDGVHLADHPLPYHGGVSKFFKRAETSAFFGREVGLMYVHAHLRYIEMLAKLGKADDLIHALLVINPILHHEAVPTSEPRQSNTYFSSSDAVFLNRQESLERHAEWKTGQIPARAGWRIYSSGPGIYASLVLSYWLGLRRCHDRLIVDPVLPQTMDGAKVRRIFNGIPFELHFVLNGRSFAPERLILNGKSLRAVTRVPHPYREGGLQLPWARVREHVHSHAHGPNTLDIVF